MSSKKKLAKEALKHPELFSHGELEYFRLWLDARKRRKERKRAQQRLDLEKVYLI